jgi:DNA-binding CsgD family transcriptional regulator
MPDNDNEHTPDASTTPDAIQTHLAAIAVDSFDDVSLESTRGDRYANGLRVPRPPQSEIDEFEGHDPAARERGRPGFRLTERERGQVVALAAIGCTYREIASVMGVSRDTIIRHCQDIIATGRAQGKMSLRRAQWRKGVIDGHPQMLIWLGKQILGQRDKQETQVTGQGGGPVEAEVTIGSAVDTVLNRLGAIAQRRRLGANTNDAIAERRELVSRANPIPEN